MPATIGDNSRLTPDEQRALFFHHFIPIQEQRSVVDAAKRRERELRKQAKVHGLLLADIDFGLRCINTEDQNIIADELARRHRIAGEFFRLPVGAQSTFDFGGPTSLDRAAKEGRAAGWRNADRASPHGVHTPEGQAWLKNYDEARAESLASLESALRKHEEVQAAKAAKKSSGHANGHDLDDEEDETD